MKSPKTPKKIRIDHYLVEQGLAESLPKAQAIILAGKIFQGEQRIQKSSELVSPQATQIRIQGPEHPYVSRGGVKLAGALRDFNIDPQGKICLDIGASTGGFTDCLLQQGAAKVYAFDCGTHQLHEKIRQDPRVQWRENFNIRHLKAEDIPELIDLIVVDVSFISLKLVIPPLLQQVRGNFELLSLVKPQFEAEPSQLEKGILRHPEVHEQILADMVAFFKKSGLDVLGVQTSQLAGGKGNREFFVFSRIT